jgi:tetratricopeptide (TPR) repeat protein
MIMARTALARALVRLERLDEARQQATEAASASAAHPMPHALAQAALSEVLRRQGMHGEALATAGTAVRIVDDLGIQDGEVAFVRLAWAEALHAAGDHDAARAAIATARDMLRAQAAMITSPELRQSFLENVEEHARVFALAEAWGALPPPRR